jgi:hypothetical protein
MTKQTNGRGAGSEVTVPVENWETADWPTFESPGTKGDDTRSGLRWRRSLIVLTTADADTNERSI